MKTEINLITKDFAYTGNLYWPRAFSLLGLLVSLALPVIVYAIFYTYQINLSSEIFHLSTEMQRLQAALKPALQMEAELETLREKFVLKDELLAQLRPWSAVILFFGNLGEQRELELQYRSASGDGELKLRGRCQSLDHVASFLHDLSHEEIVLETALTYISLMDGFYEFEIDIYLVEGGLDLK